MHSVIRKLSSFFSLKLSNAFFFTTVLSLITRLYHLRIPPQVCWDETHFGKHINGYIQRRYFFDVHPPLGKLLLAFAGVLSGYDGTFPFKEPGQPFPENMNFVYMRLLPAVLGALSPSLLFGALYSLKFSLETCFFAALLMICDTYCLILSRYILLEGFTAFFQNLAVFAYCRFRTYTSRPFTKLWWIWLFLTGFSLGCCLGVKWTGAFVVFLIGLSTAYELWNIWGDLRNSPKTVLHHFLARVVCLIVVPLALYVSFFWVHFSWAFYSGQGDGFMSSKFQLSIVGNPLAHQLSAKRLVYGAKFTLRNAYTGGGLLHSHADLYPKEFSQALHQQVTTYTFKDGNNDWYIKKLNQSVAELQVGAPVPVLHGDLVRLKHVRTSKHLHSHNVPAPMTPSQKQVFGCNHNDSNDYWQILVDGYAEPVRPDKSSATPVIEVVNSLVRFRHVNEHCYLHYSGMNLPNWGFEQGEVTCNPFYSKSGNLWNFETIADPRVEAFTLKHSKPLSFLERVVELNALMMEVSNKFKPKPGENPSRPWDWPLLKQGYHFNPYYEHNHRIFLMGNPLVFGVCGLSLIAYCFLLLFYAIIRGKGVEHPYLKHRSAVVHTSGAWLFLGYLLHYLPFYFITRVLYFHHYLPALLFNFMVSGVVFEELLFWLRAWKPSLFPSRLLLLFSTGALIYSFVYFSPFAYGMTGDKKLYNHLKWGAHWLI